MILRCADGLSSKAELGVHEHTVGKWRRRFLKSRIEGLYDEVNPDRPCIILDDESRGNHRADADDDTKERDPLVNPLDGQRGRPFSHDDPADLDSAELTRKKIQRGIHTSVRQLEADIKAFINAHHENPKPYCWAKSADEILASVKCLSKKNGGNIMCRTLDSDV